VQRGRPCDLAGRTHHSKSGAPRADYGPCSYDVPNLFNAGVVYFSHSGHGRLLSYLLSDWQIAPLMRYETGFPINSLSGRDNSLTGIGLDRPNVVAGQPLYASSGRSSILFQWINPGRFVQNTTGTFEDAGHYSMRTPSYFDVDAAVSRVFRAEEGFNLEARVESFHTTNHPNFGGPYHNSRRPTHSAGRNQIHLLENLPTKIAEALRKCI